MFNYDVDDGERFSPVVAKLYAMMWSNMNTLFCGKVMSAAYLAKYAQVQKNVPPFHCMVTMMLKLTWL